MSIKKDFKFLLFYIPGVLLLVFFCGCEKELTDKKTTIRIAGSSTIIPVATKAAEQFIHIHPNIDITVSPGGSGVGVKSAGNRLVDIGMVARDISEEERENFPKAHFELYLIGRDAVACVISSEIYEAGLHALSREQLQDIYSGEINNWKEVGGPDKEILCIDKEFHRGARQVFMTYVFGDKEAQAKGTDLVVGDNNETQTKVALSDAAITMVSFAWINADVRGLGIRVGEEIIQPTVENTQNGLYPISRNLFFITNGTPSGIVKDYIDFVLGPQGQKIVEESGFISIQ
jgi:phosphate transport system substrate-binding protein